MKLLIELPELNAGSSRSLFPLECEKCGKIFQGKKNDILNVLKNPKRNTLKYCSLDCFYGSKITKIQCECKQCKKVFEKTASQAKKHPNHFCSSSCAAKYNNAHKTKGTRRSKLEVWLESELMKFYPNLEIHFNRKDAINSELDIYIPSLKLAFELNGIFHYEPIYGEEKLKLIQNNDSRKFQACLERGIELCIIDSSELSYFKIQKAKKYLNIIINIINKNWSIASGRTDNLLITS